MECYKEIVRFIRSYDSPEQVLKTVQHAPSPRRFKKAKKLLCKEIRKYMRYEWRNDK